jgi:hypothetical protein
VEQWEHTVLESVDLHIGTTAWRREALRQQHGAQGGRGCPTTFELSEWMASCHWEVAEENLPAGRSGWLSADVVDGEKAAEVSLQSDATSALG